MKKQLLFCIAILVSLIGFAVYGEILPYVKPKQQTVEFYNKDVPTDANIRWSEISKAIEEKEYEKVIYYTIGYREVDEDSDVLYNYASSQTHKEDEEEYEMEIYLARIPTDYKGKFSELILEEKLLYATIEEWDKKYEESVEYEKSLNSRLSSTNSSFSSTPAISEPSIGMTANEVEQSSWGYPKDTNITTTAYGVSEQWVYSDYRYIYLEDGIVTTIQE